MEDIGTDFLHLKVWVAGSIGNIRFRIINIVSAEVGWRLTRGLLEVY